MRSRCRRSIITMSALRRPSRMSRQTSTPKFSMPGGNSVEGATTRTRAPSVLSRMMLERATRECRMSPQIATVSASIGPLLRRMVSASSSAWVGCSWAPSPALITEQSTLRARSSTAPEAWWRTTRMSGCMALRVIAVSISVSPLRIEDEETDMFMTSAPSRLPASSNEDWVRVEASKNRLTWVRPRSDARFFSIWRLRSTNSSARSSNPVISSCESPSIPNRWRWWRTNDVFGAMFIKAALIGGVRGPGKGGRGMVPRLGNSSPLGFSLSPLVGGGSGRGHVTGALSMGGLAAPCARRCRDWEGRRPPHSRSAASGRGNCIPSQPVERALQDVDRGVLVDHRLALGAAGIGGDQLALDRGGGEALVPQARWEGR